jgi:hypothetical protein
VHPAYRGIQQDLSKEFTELMDRVDGTSLHADRLEQRPRGVGSAAASGSQAVYFDAAAKNSAREARQEYIESRLSNACWTDRGLAAGPWMEVVDDWLMDVPLGVGAATGTPAEASRKWFMSLDENTRRAWFRNHSAEFLDCRLTTADFR